MSTRGGALPACIALAALVWLAGLVGLVPPATGPASAETAARDSASAEPRMRDAASAETAARDSASAEPRTREAASAEARPRDPALADTSDDPAAEEPAEPPPEAVPGADVELESADSLMTGTLDVDVGASGNGRRVRERRRVRIRDAGFAAEARDGAGDPLAGGSLTSAGLSLGRLSPLWGQGLVLGAAVEPWRRAGGAGEGQPLLRRRVAQGVAWRPGRGAGVEVLAARFTGDDLAGARLRHGAFGAGVVSDARGGAQASVALDGERGAAELAMDRAGRWRAAGALAHPLGELALAARARAGLAGFRSLADPARSGPAVALAVGVTRASPRLTASALGALWRFRSDWTGARAALEVSARLPHHDRLAGGLEEQRGARHEPPGGAGGMRQGVWGEWRGGARDLSLELRTEIWGEASWVRSVVRRVSLAGVDVRGPAGVRLAVTEAVYRARSGESLYLTEAGSDRLVLRALTGAGERTRIEVAAPVAHGRARAALSVRTTPTAAPRLEWTCDWERRTREPSRAR